MDTIAERGVKCADVDGEVVLGKGESRVNGEEEEDCGDMKVLSGHFGTKQSRDGPAKGKELT